MNAGAVAVRVVLGLEVPPLPDGAEVLVGVVVVVLVVVLVRGTVVEVCSGSGVLATLTVFVPPPQPASSAASARPRRGMGVFERRGRIVSMIFVACRAPPRSFLGHVSGGVGPRSSFFPPEAARFSEAALEIRDYVEL